MLAIDTINGNVSPPHTTSRQAKPVETSTAAPAPKAVPTDQEDMAALAKELAQNLESLGQGHTVAFREDEETGADIVEIRDRNGEVLNQFPPEKILNLRKVLADLSGVVINRMT
ncbi:hypothetical protein CO151_00015 [bacterium CG_4_9_14_3_um_filter_65_15]|nr:MAG: hypothetical protein CO151_00015 [bacterium CG_4_9_14_3_um_filter_65_15]